MKKLILNIEVCIWKKCYLILKFVLEKIDIKYWILYLKKFILNIEACKKWYYILKLVKNDIKFWIL